MKRSTKKDYAQYDKEIIDIDEIDGNDIKLNPEYYIHKTLLKMQDALVKDNLKEGMVMYRLLAEHAEVLCRGWAMLDDEYDDELKKFKDSKEYKGVDGDLAKGVKLSDKKVELILARVSSSSPLLGHLKA